MQERLVLMHVHWFIQYHGADLWLWGGGGRRQAAGRQINSTSQSHNKGHRGDDSIVVFQLPVQAEGVCGEVKHAQVQGLQTVTGVAVILRLFWRESYCLHWKRQGECTSVFSDVEVIKGNFLQLSAFDLKVNVDGFLLSIHPTDVDAWYL